MYHEIEVTQADIDGGVPNAATDCAITKAALRSGLFDKAPLLATCRGYEDDKPYVYITPNFVPDKVVDRIRIEADIDVNKWVRRFDMNIPVQPFSFKIDIP